ncbi:TOM1-like protein 1 isoform X2 [Cricetulus griseus]|uniref:TOM1-like protein 1 isoform X2 n=1 Tax=Cricetulus griseus TaxID=10029 RepID=A0A8C2LZ82_CRIGR|nr:TOM1-like protein 1 isoform X2 [Cricetulus griseus]XP_035303302.1 TOM1-like protein 1 isoform X2 [Cricetulus griseus]
MAFGKSHRDPYATSVGHLVEKATFAGVQTEDWGQFMHICDIINTTQDGPKDAVKALKKRISKNYNHKEIQLSLSLIDMCMQNCGPSFQSLIVKKEFIKDALVKLLNPRYTLPLDIQNRILNFIKIGKLHSELDMVKMNVKVMTAILMENTPGSENHEDIELLQKLYKTGREMQERIMDLLVVVENEDVTVELIQVNEDLNNAILGYERFTRNQQRLLEQNRNSKDATDTSNEPSAPSCDLLDLSPIVPMPMSNGEALHTVNSQLSALSVSSPSPVVTNSLYPSLHPQVDLLASENTELPSLFAQRTSPNLASSHTYDNFLEHSSSVLLQPVSLQTATAAPASQRLPTLPSNHPVITNNDLQPPNYYEVMEFDPLAPATEAVYEEIDDYHHKGAQSHSDC